MKIIQLVLIYLLFMSSNLVAQSTYFTIKESEKFRDTYYKTSVKAVYTSANNETVVARRGLRDLLFEIYSDDVKLVFDYIVKLERRERIMGDLFYENTIRLFSVVRPSKKERIIYCHMLNVKTKKYQKIELFRTVVEKKQLLFSGQNKRQTNLTISPNEEFLAIATDNIKKNSNSYLIHVFNAKTLTLLYTKAYYSNKEKFFRSSDMAIDNSGTIYNLGKEYVKGRRDKKDKKANYTFVLNKIDKNTIQTQKIKLDEQEFIASLRIVFRENTMNLVGFYSTKKSGRIKGVTQFLVDDATLSILKKKSFELPKKVYEDIYGSRNANKRSKKELKRFYLDYFLEDGLGNVYLLAEEFYITQTYVAGGMNGVGGYATTTPHYDDVLILKFNTEGKLEWGRSILKRDGAPSYNAFIHKDKLHVLFNSGKKLREKKDGRIKATKRIFESTSLYDYIYDEKGNVTRERIRSNKGVKKYIPYLGNFRNEKFVMYNHSRKIKQLMILESKD